MKAIHFLLILTLTAGFLSCGKQNDYQVKVNLNAEWKFSLESDSSCISPDYDDSDWRVVDLPHDWSIELPLAEENPGGRPNGFFAGGTGWYRKKLNIPDNYLNKSLYLQFEGIYRNVDIWINGYHAGKQLYGYNEINLDIDPYIEYGKENIIVVRANNALEPMDRWYHGCGIYRDVNLIVANKVHIPLHGTFIRNEVFDSLDASIKISTELINENPYPVEVMLVSHAFHPEEGKVGVASSERFLLKKDTIIDQIIEIEIPDWWSPENPVVYDLFSDILSEKNTILDTYVSKFGIRQPEFNPEKGFLLNYKKLELKGVCIHHDLGVSGAAFYPSLMRTRLLKLKENGVNAIRLSHNPHEPELLDMCDELGFIVIDELYDKWETPWVQHDVDPVKFIETMDKDVEIFVKRDRNHPSVVIWSAGNETIEQVNDPERGLEILSVLIEKFDEFDPSREVTCAMISAGENPSRLIDLTKVVSYNYQVHKHSQWRKLYPEKIFIATETRVYQENNVEDYSKLDFSKNSWFMLKEEDAGQFIWTGFDYFGESLGWPYKGVEIGLLTTGGFLKPYGQFTRSIYSDKPFVHITVMDQSKLKELVELETWWKKWYGPSLSDHWNWNEDSVELYIFTNENEIHLELNGKSLGVYEKNDFHGGVIYAKIPYEPGEIKAVTGENKLSHSLKTAGSPAKLMTKIRDYGKWVQSDSITEIEVWVTDENSVPCPVSDFLIKTSYSENLKYIGADNGDMKDLSLFKNPYREVRDGRCLFVFQGKSGKVEFTSAGLEGASLTIDKSK
jgi:beta-galactosidase